MTRFEPASELRTKAVYGGVYWFSSVHTGVCHVSILLWDLKIINFHGFSDDVDRTCLDAWSIAAGCHVATT